MFSFGVDRLLQEKELQAKLFDKRLAFLGHPASVTRDLRHSLDALSEIPGFKFVAGFGPQHGMRGEKQDNMIESDDYVDPIHKIPVYSLYGKVRKPTPEMLKGWDVLLFDLQDVGARLYTFLTTLIYMMEALNSHSDKEIWVLDRPNPAGRPVEGHRLDPHFESFVGAVPIPMRHGLTLGEVALWYKEHRKLKVHLTVVGMKDHVPGWPASAPWVNPSPNIPRLSCVRQYSGSVLIEGTNLSEGRGTTIPLEVVGAPTLNADKVVAMIKSLAPQWTQGCALRPCYYEPTFHKFKGQLCGAIQVHCDGAVYDEQKFMPYRLYNLLLKSIRRVHPEIDVWKQPPYEYETEKMPIDILSGHSKLRAWADDSSPKIAEWDESLRVDESSWTAERKLYLLY